MLSLILCSALGVVSGWSVAAPLDEAGTCRAYTLVDDATGRVIRGPEDIAIDRASGVVYVSAYDRRAVEHEKAAGGPVTTVGGIYRFALPRGLPDGGSIAVTDLTSGFRETHDFRPHGFHFRPGDPARLHVVNRVYEMKKGKPVINPAIERFRIEGGALVHEATIRPGANEPVMCSPNDLWTKADGTFYVSNDHGACTGFGSVWEETFALRHAYLLYYDGSSFRKVAEKLAFANGVTGRENANGEIQIIVSETRGKRLRVFDEADLLATGEPGSGKVKPRHTIKLKGSPDNLDWDRGEAGDGDLLVATIPNIIGMATYMRGLFGKKKTGSRIQRIPWGADGKPGAPEIVFEDNGSMISGATVMAGAGGLYFIGAAFDDNIAICAESSSQ
ncbi:MAG: hypothetical protein IID51_07280 [Proteobacteria bacterium]|nr:hypothetical protein [Pseudomonadota bacterium]